MRGQNGSHAKVLDATPSPFLEWLPGDEFSALCHVSLAPGDDPLEEVAIAGPGE